MSDQRLLEKVFEVYRWGGLAGLPEGADYQRLLGFLLRGESSTALSLDDVLTQIGELRMEGMVEELLRLKEEIETGKKQGLFQLSDVYTALFKLGQRDILATIRRLLTQESVDPVLPKETIDTYLETIRCIGESEDLGLLVRLFPHPEAIGNCLMHAIRGVGWRTLRVRLMMALGLPEEEVNSYLAIHIIGVGYFPAEALKVDVLRPFFDQEIKLVLKECESPRLTRKVLALRAVHHLPNAKRDYLSELQALAAPRISDDPVVAHARDFLACSLKH